MNRCCSPPDDISWLGRRQRLSIRSLESPHLFREIAAVHSPMWRQGVERALGAWGAHVALLVSRHVMIYRHTDRHHAGEADAAAAQTSGDAKPIEGLRKLRRPGRRRPEGQCSWRWSTLSLALCGEA